MGRTPIKIFEYNEKGVFIRKFKTEAECRAFHYPDDIGKRPTRPFERLEIKFGKTPDGNYLFTERIGREKIKLVIRVYNSEYCTDLIKEDKKIIQVFNLENILLLEARNLNTLSKLTGINSSTILTQVKRKPGSKASKIMPNGLIFKYKQEEIDL